MRTSSRYLTVRQKCTDRRRQLQILIDQKAESRLDRKEFKLLDQLELVYVQRDNLAIEQAIAFNDLFT